MRSISLALSALVLPVFLLQVAPAQTTTNPDISVIPRFLLSTNDGEKLSEGKREFSQPDLSFQELELAIQAYLNPFAKADIILTIPGPDVEAGKLGIEEAYATVVRGLPLDLNLKVGKYRAEFGKLNQVHPHAWPFISQPLVQSSFLGEEGLNDLGISASILLPTGDIYSRFTMDLLRGSAVGGTTGIIDSTGRKPLYAVSGRLSGFIPLTDESDFEAGISEYTGIHDPYNRERFWYTNIDAKYKYRSSSYTSLVVQGEYLFNSRRAMQNGRLIPFMDAAGSPEERSVKSSGMYLYADYQFFKLYSLGARYDWSESPYSKDERKYGGAIFFGYYPVEETLGLRLEYQNETMLQPGTSRTVNTIALQVLFSLGPHKAHPF